MVGRKQYEIRPCMMCRGEEYEVAEYHKTKDGLEDVIGAIKCTKCGKVYYTLNKLVKMKDKGE